MNKIQCIADIRELEKEHSVPKELIALLYQDMQALYYWADSDHITTLEDFHADMFDYGYIALLNGTETAQELEDGIGLTGGYENTIPETAEIHYWGSEKWARVVVIYNDSYSMVLWIRNYDGFDSYAVPEIDSHQSYSQQAPF